MTKVRFKMNVPNLFYQRLKLPWPRACFFKTLAGSSLWLCILGLGGRKRLSSPDSLAIQLMWLLAKRKNPKAREHPTLHSLYWIFISQIKPRSHSAVFSISTIGMHIQIYIPFRAIYSQCSLAVASFPPGRKSRVRRGRTAPCPWRIPAPERRACRPRSKLVCICFRTRRRNSRPFAAQLYHKAKSPVFRLVCRLLRCRGSILRSNLLLPRSVWCVRQRLDLVRSARFSVPSSTTPFGDLHKRHKHNIRQRREPKRSKISPLTEVAAKYFEDSQTYC